MSRDDTITTFTISTQIKLFEDVRYDLQMTHAELAKQMGVCKATVDAWAQGRNALSFAGMKKLARVEAVRPLLSRFWEPEGLALVSIPQGLDFDHIAEQFHDFLQTKTAAHHPDSPSGRELSECEKADLAGKVAQIGGGK